MINSKRAADPVTLEIFKHLFASVAEEMGITLRRTAYSPNIKERLDFSCALFDDAGRLLAQAAHIPVHLGAMPASVRSAIDRCAPFARGDVVLLNDPYLGGTHLPDLTMVSPVFVAGIDQPIFYVASRAHHADVGGMSPGSMPLSREIYQEGLIIPPIKIVQAGRNNDAALDLILRNVRTPDERRGDLSAQIAAHAIGARRANEIVTRYGLDQTLDYAAALRAYGERLTRNAIAAIPKGTYAFEDHLDGDGVSNLQSPISIKVKLTIQEDVLIFDFTGSSPSVSGNLNAVRAIVESAVYYCVRCIIGAMGLADATAPVNAGTFAPVKVIIPRGTLLDADPPHAVAGGNVETSQRVVDVVFGALAQALPNLIASASQGTMNNLAFGGVRADGRPFAYYETIGGGAGAGPNTHGASGIHVHMSNTLNTPIEALELAFPLRVHRYAIRRNSGGDGLHRGGDGLIREIEFLQPVHATLLSDRRETQPYGLRGAEPGASGENVLIHANVETNLPGKVALYIEQNDVLSIQTPGGGGWGTKSE